MSQQDSTASTQAHGDAQAVADLGASRGTDIMPKSLGDLAKRLVEAGGGGAPAAPEPERRGLSELSLRVLGRWGALPTKAIACVFGWSAAVPEEDAQLLGECSVDLVRHSSVAPDPRTEAIGRWLVAHGAVVAEGYLALMEKRLEKKRAEQAVNGA